MLLLQTQVEHPGRVETDALAVYWGICAIFAAIILGSLLWFAISDWWENR